MLRTSVRSSSFYTVLRSFSVATVSFYLVHSAFGRTYKEDSFRGVIEC